MTDLIILGRIGSAHGIKGWSKVISFTDPQTNILKYRKWLIQHQNEWQPIIVENSKVEGTQIIVKLLDCNDRDQAKTFTNNLIAVRRKELPLLPKEEYYWVDLIGLRVITLHGDDLGTVTQIMATGANDVLEVEGDTRKRLIPYTKNVIKEIDMENKVVIVDWDPEF